MLLQCWGRWAVSPVFWGTCDSVLFCFVLFLLSFLYYNYIFNFYFLVVIIIILFYLLLLYCIIFILLYIHVFVFYILYCIILHHYIVSLHHYIVSYYIITSHVAGQTRQTRGRRTQAAR